MSKEVAKVKTTDVANVPEHLKALMEQNQGIGLAKSTDDYAIPFLSVLQDLSPQCKRQRSEYIEGALPGDIFNSVTGELWSGSPVIVIPCYYEPAFIEWVPREDGGGFIGKHPSDTPLRGEVTRDERGRDVLPNGHHLVATAQFYVLTIGDEGLTDKAVIAMSSTQLKKSRQWNTLIGRPIKLGPGMIIRFPNIYTRTFELTSKPESNDKGDWYGWNIKELGVVDDPLLYQEAEAFHKAVAAGEEKADYNQFAENEKQAPEAPKPQVEPTDTPF